jgi:hypothetical protein
VDLVFAIDQSGSMWGQADYRGVPNDPNRYRIAVVEKALQLLASRTNGTSDIYRIAVVEFATKARVALPPTEFHFDPAAPGALAQLAATSAAMLGSLPSLGNRANIDDFLTDTPAALKLAHQQMLDMQASDPDPARKRVIVLITDGHPYRHGEPVGSVFDETEREARQVTHDGILLHILGINDIAGADAGYWQRGDGARWKSIVGNDNAELAQPVGDKLPRRVLAIIDQSVGGHSNIAFGQRFQIGPYESHLAVSVTLDRPTTVLPILTTPSGNKLRAHPPPPGGSQTLGFDLPNPPKGNYEVQFGRDAAGYLVTGQVSHSLTHARVSLVSPGTVALNRPADIELQVVGASDSDAISIEPSWPLGSVTATLTPATGAMPERVSLRLVPPGRLTGTWSPRQAGTYRLSVDGTYTSAFDGSQQTLFQPGATSASLTVTNRIPFNLVPVQTANRSLEISPLGSQSVELRFEAKENVSGPDIPIRSVFGSATRPATLTLLDPSGQPAPGSAPIPMRLVDNALVATVPVSINWLGGEGWLPWSAPKTLSVGIHVDANTVPSDRLYGGVALPPGSGLSRVRSPDPDNTAAGFRVVGAAWLLAVMALLAVLTIAIVAGALGFVLIRLLGVRLEDGRRNKSVQFVIFPSDKGVLMGPGLRKFDLTGRRTTNLDRQVQLRTDSGPVLLDRLRARRLPGDDRQARVEIRYRIRGAKKEQSLKLRSGDGAPSEVLAGLDDKWSAALVLETKRQRQN